MNETIKTIIVGILALALTIIAIILIK